MEFPITILNTANLEKQIINAEDALKRTYEISADGTDIPNNWTWVTADMQTNLKATLEAAKAVPEDLKAKVEAMDALVLALDAYKPATGLGEKASYRIGSENLSKIEIPSEGTITFDLVLTGRIVTTDNYENLEVAWAKVEDGVPEQALAVSEKVFDENTGELTLKGVVTQFPEIGEYRLYCRLNSDGVFHAVDDSKTLTVVAAP